MTQGVLSEGCEDAGEPFSSPLTPHRPAVRAFSPPTLHPGNLRISDAGEPLQSSRAMLYDTVFPGHKENMTGTHCSVKLIHKPLQRLNTKTYGKTPTYYFSKLVDSYI